MIVTRNLIIDQGSSFSESFVAKKDGQIIDLTNYTVVSEIRKIANSYMAYPFTANITSAATGEFTLEMEPDQSEMMEGGRYYYDIELHSTTSSQILKIVEGIVIVIPQISSSNPFISEQGIKRVNPDAIHVHENLDQLKIVKWWTLAETNQKVVEWGDKLIIVGSIGYELIIPENPQAGFEFDFIDFDNTFGLSTGVVIRDDASPTPNVIETVMVSGKYNALYTGASWKITQVG